MSETNNTTIIFNATLLQKMHIKYLFAALYHMGVRIITIACHYLDHKYLIHDQVHMTWNSKISHMDVANTLESQCENY